LPVSTPRLAAFLALYHVAGEPVTAAQAREAAARILELDGLSPAELAARGYRQLTVVHGDP
jgi:hypothetical protein